MDQAINFGYQRIILYDSKSFLRSYFVMAIPIAASEDVLVRRQYLKLKCINIYEFEVQGHIPQ